MTDKINLWKDLPTCPSENTVFVVVEIPKGSRNKYEFVSGEQSYMILDRVMHSPVIYSGDYGLVPQTLWEDGDPLDALIVLDEPTFPGCVVECRPVAFLEMRDQGKRDDKVIFVPVRDARYDGVKDKDDLPKQLLDEIANFFAIYKQIEGKECEILGWKGQESAWKAVRHAQKLFEEKATNV